MYVDNTELSVNVFIIIVVELTWKFSVCPEKSLQVNSQMLHFIKILLSCLSFLGRLWTLEIICWTYSFKKNNNKFIWPNYVTKSMVTTVVIAVKILISCHQDLANITWSPGSMAVLFLHRVFLQWRRVLLRQFNFRSIHAFDLYVVPQMGWILSHASRIVCDSQQVVKTGF